MRSMGPAKNRGPSAPKGVLADSGDLANWFNPSPHTRKCLPPPLNGTRERFVLTKKVSGYVAVHVWVLSDAKGNSAIHRVRGRHTADAHCNILEQVSCLMFPWTSKVIRTWVHVRHVHFKVRWIPKTRSGSESLEYKS